MKGRQCRENKHRRQEIGRYENDSRGRNDEEFKRVEKNIRSSERVSRKTGDELKSQTDNDTYGASDAAKRVTCMRNIPVGYHLLPPRSALP